MFTGDNSDSLVVDGRAVATVRRRADELLRRAKLSAGGSRAADPGPLLALGFPDRIAQSSGGARYRLRHGSVATLPEHDPLAGSGWLVAAEIRSGPGHSHRGADPPRGGARPGGRRVDRCRRDRDGRPGRVGRRGRRSAGDDRTCPRLPRPRCGANRCAGGAGDHRGTRGPSHLDRSGAARMVERRVEPPDCVPSGRVPCSVGPGRLAPMMR